jgi:uncharacterized protein
MARKTTSVFRNLDRDEIEAVLARNHVARVAYTHRNRIDIEPINYVFADGWVYARTSAGAKLTTLAHSPWVALEVDEVEGPFDWRSVVVRGTLLRMDPGTTVEAAEHERALRALRELTPGAFGPKDPTPFRTVILGMKVDDATGRAATTHGTTHGS